MKKLFALILAFSFLFLLSCGEATPSETTEATPTSQTTAETTEALPTSQTEPTETTEPTSESQTEASSTEPTETARQEDVIQTHGMLISTSESHTFFETESRVIFCSNEPREDFAAYYSKADGNGYRLCFDPVCQHRVESCSSFAIQLSGSRSTTYKDRIYYQASGWTDPATGEYGTALLSCKFDGTDIRTEYQISFEFMAAYDRYIYIEKTAGNGYVKLFRYDMETREMRNLSEEQGYPNMTGLPSFFYNGKMYFYTLVGFGEANLDLSDYKETSEQAETLFRCCRTSRCYGSKAASFIYVETDEKLNQTYTYNGLHIYDIETNEETLIPPEVCGGERGRILYVDADYIYYGIVLDSARNANWSQGKIYRIKWDGTCMSCIYDNPEMFIPSYYGLYVTGDTMLICMVSYGMKTGLSGAESVKYNKEVYVAHIEKNGKLTDVHELVIE